MTTTDKSVPCACKKEFGDLCPICYGWGTIMQPYSPRKTTGEVLPEEVRYKLIKAMVSAGGGSTARVEWSKKVKISDQTFIRAVRGASVSLPLIRRIYEALGTPLISSTSSVRTIELTKEEAEFLYAGLHALKAVNVGYAKSIQDKLKVIL